MKIRILTILILVWTVIAFIVDAYLAIDSGKITGTLVISILMLRAVVCWIAYQVYLGKRWAIIVLAIYYGAQIINIYLPEFAFYTKSGLNMEIAFGQTIGVNLFTLIVFILLLRVLRVTDGKKS